MIDEFKGENLSIKELAGILKVSYSKIYRAYEAGFIPGIIKTGPEGTRCDILIPKWGARVYIESFEEN
jgi:hypothetical protein